MWVRVSGLDGEQAMRRIKRELRPEPTALELLERIERRIEENCLTEHPELTALRKLLEEAGNA